MWELIIQFSLSILLLVVSADLLYLFYTKAWYDPNKKIEMVEVVALYAIAGGSLVNAVRTLAVLLGG